MSRTKAMAAFMVVVCVAGTAEGRHRYSRCVPIFYCPPDLCCICWPYHPPCPPNTGPLVPLPAHPVPHTLLKHELTIKNSSYSHHFAAIYIRHSDCVYREYERIHRRAGDSAPAAQPYFANDDLYVETWAWDGHCWRFQCRSFITLGGGASTFDIARCIHSN
jgi:hypothetical protein